MADNLQATPRNELLGLLSDAMYGGLDWMKDPRRSQQMQGLAGLLESTGIPQTTQRMAYGEPLTNIGRANVPLLKPETADALMNVAPLAPAAGRLASRAVKATEGLPVGMSIKDVSYRGSHLAPNAKNYGATLDDLTKILPEDVYSQQGKQLYGFGDRMIDSEWRIAALKARGKPNAEVEIFRAVPKGVKDINSGDWVSTSKTYAKQHGETTLGGDYEIISKKVPAKTLSTEGYPYEYGYNINFEYPQQAALDLAQKRAALPVSEGGLGLPANNTPMDRAKAMGFTTEGYRGSTVAETTHKNPLWWSEDPQYASAYAAHTIRPPKGQPDPYAGNVMPVLVNIGKSKEFEKFNIGGVPTDPFSGFKEGVETGFRRYSKNEVTGDMGGKVWEALTLPQNVRSRFAAFDPFRKDVATATAMGVALPDLLAAEPAPQPQSSGLLYPFP